MNEIEKKNNRQSMIIVICGLVVAALIAAGVAVVLNNLPRSLGTSDTSVTEVKTIFNRDLIGTWHSADQVFSAKITNGEIDLRLNANGGDMALWYGTFDSNPKQTGVIIKSVSVPGHIYWSSEKEKDFTYVSDRLTFKFSAAEVSKTVELVRG
jgi:hypothetical protein